MLYGYSIRFANYFRYLIYGMRGLGAEVAKHLILNGVSEVHFYDPTPIEERDLSSNYFIRHKFGK